MAYHWRKSWKYYFEMEDIAFVPGKKFLFTNWYTYNATVAPTEKDGDFYVAIEDLKKLFAPDMKFSEEADGKVKVLYEFTYSDETFVPDYTGHALTNLKEGTLYQSVVDTCQIEGVPCVPIKKLLVDDFGFVLSSMVSHEGNTIYNISLLGHTEVDFEDDATMEKRKSKTIDNVIHGKCMGDLNRTFWFEEGNRLMPYMLFVPSCYDGTKPLPLVTALHGGAPEPNLPNVAQRSHGKMQFLAEDLGWFVMIPYCYARNGTYGYVVPPNRGRGEIDYDCPENPGHFSDEMLERIRLSGVCLEKNFEDVFAHYNIDKEHLYLTGNSMGGGGTFYFAASHPGMFKAIVPTGAFCNADLYPDEGLGDTPVLSVAGMEDRHGYDYIRYDALKLKEKGHNVTLRSVGGGQHGDAWMTVLPEIFQFFVDNY